MRTENLVLAQVTDTHIGVTSEPMQGVDARGQLRAVLDDVASQGVDLVVVTGDLAFEYGERESYQWLYPCLEESSLPYVVMAGNHDNVERLVEEMKIDESDLRNGHLAFQRTLKGRRLFFLDSSSYRVSPDQIEWLRSETEDGAPALLFIHHPPVLCGARFMDNQCSLHGKEKTWEALRTLPIDHIFCGHYHLDRVVWKDGKKIYLTPSTMLQIDPDEAEFAIASTTPGWRHITWSEDGVKTSVRYVDC